MIETLSKYDIMRSHFRNFNESEPFNHIVIDNFFEDDVVEKLVDEFPDYESDQWHVYDNALEHKKTCNEWNKFSKHTYSVMNHLNSNEFLSKMSLLTNEKLFSDPGLHGGGWHIHGRGGKLNVHLDYDIHPKMQLQRKLNLIVYMTKDWNPEWGGGLEFWSHDDVTNGPKECVTKIENVFNRAVLFDTTQNSWHGLPEPLNCPENTYRRSLAVYYLHTPSQIVDGRERALFAPHKEQKDDPAILELIQKRVDSNAYKEAYRK